MLADLIRDGFWVAALVLVPVIVAGAAASFLAGLLSQRLGLADAGLASVLRTVAIAAAVAVWGTTMAEQVSVFTQDAWTELARPAGEP